MDYCGRPHTNIINPSRHTHLYTHKSTQTRLQSQWCVSLNSGCELCSSSGIDLLKCWISRRSPAASASFCLAFLFFFSCVLNFTLFMSPLSFLPCGFTPMLCLLYFSSSCLFCMIVSESLFLFSHKCCSQRPCSTRLSWQMSVTFFSMFLCPAGGFNQKEQLVFLSFSLWPTQNCQPKLLCPWLWDWKGSGLCVYARINVWLGIGI